MGHQLQGFSLPVLACSTFRYTYFARGLCKIGACSGIAVPGAGIPLSPFLGGPPSYPVLDSEPFGNSFPWEGEGVPPPVHQRNVISSSLFRELVVPLYSVRSVAHQEHGSINPSFG